MTPGFSIFFLALRRSSPRSPGEPEWPLRVIIVGHNPSEKAWELGHYYGNPTNKMWKLLSTTGIVPPGFTASNDDDCPIASGVGFTDVVRTTAVYWEGSSSHDGVQRGQRAATAASCDLFCRNLSGCMQKSPLF